MIKLDDLAYVRIGTQQLDKQVEFATEIVGLELVKRSDEGAYFRADDRGNVVQIVPGEPRTLSSAFTVRDEATLIEAKKYLETQDIEVTEGTDAEARDRGVRGFISFKDTGNNTVELVHGQVRFESRPVSFTRPAGITEFGHLGLEAPDVVEAQKFWTGHFSVEVSDWIGTTACLMRIDPVHHKLAVFNESTGLGHVNFQVGSIDDIMRNYHFLQYHGVEIVMGPGRHPQSTAIFLYYLGPENVTWEYSAGVRLLPDDGSWRPRTFDPGQPDFIDKWKGGLVNLGKPWSER